MSHDKVGQGYTEILRGVFSLILQRERLAWYFLSGNRCRMFVIGHFLSSMNLSNDITDGIAAFTGNSTIKREVIAE